MRLPRFQFSLRTSLIVLTIGTLLCWGYSLDIPRWKVRREREHFLNTAKTIKVGMPTSEAHEILDSLIGQGQSMVATSDTDAVLVQALQEDVYGVHLISTDNGRNSQISVVEIFWIDARPADPDELSNLLSNFAKQHYWHHNDRFVGNTLIYSDPPEK